MIATAGSKAAEDAAYIGIKFARQNGAQVYAVDVVDITGFDSILMDKSWGK